MFSTNPLIDSIYPTFQLAYGSTEYLEAAAKKLPTRPPRYMPGQLVCSSYHGANVPVLRCMWLQECGWAVQTPGYTDRENNFSPAKAGAPTIAYQRVGEDTWEERERIGASDDGTSPVGARLPPKKRYVPKPKTRAQSQVKTKPQSQAKTKPHSRSAKPQAKTKTVPKIANTRTAAGRAAYDNAVLEAVPYKPTGVGPIRDAAGGKPAQVRASLNRLIERGKVDYKGKARGTKYQRVHNR